MASSCCGFSRGRSLKHSQRHNTFCFAGTSRCCKTNTAGLLKQCWKHKTFCFVGIKMRGKTICPSSAPHTYFCIRTMRCKEQLLIFGSSLHMVSVVQYMYSEKRTDIVIKLVRALDSSSIFLGSGEKVMPCTCNLVLTSPSDWVFLFFKGKISGGKKHTSILLNRDVHIGYGSSHMAMGRGKAASKAVVIHSSLCYGEGKLVLFLFWLTWQQDLFSKVMILCWEGEIIGTEIWSYPCCCQWNLCHEAEPGVSGHIHPPKLWN